MTNDQAPGDAPAASGTWTLLNDEMRHRLDVQRDAFSRIEGRAAILLGATFAALQFVASKPIASPWLGWAVGAYAGAMACSLIAVLPGRFKETRPRSLLVGLWLYPPERAAAELANNRLIAFEENVGRQGRMAFLVRASVGLGVAGAIMSTLHLMEGIRTDVERSPAVTAGCSGGAAGAGGCGTAP